MPKGYSMVMKNNALELFDFQAISWRLYEIRLSATMTTQDSLLWHYRFCHLNLKRLVQLLEKALILGVPKLAMPEKSCEVCLVGKNQEIDHSVDMFLIDLWMYYTWFTLMCLVLLRFFHWEEIITFNFLGIY